MARIGSHYFFVLICHIQLSFSLCAEENDFWEFPDNFLFGAGTSSYQVEGAWNVSDKGESVWDRFTHEKSYKISDGSNGDVACDSYHNYKDDVRLLKEVGVNYYRFSISWTRILPTGYSNVISKDGIKYYHNILNELEKNKIWPIVTIYHWDHPQLFQEIGGWTNEAMVELYANYARIVFEEFGDRVKFFTTVNEPYEVCRQGLFLGNFAPGLKIGRHPEYLCTHNILKAHARAYHIYNDEFRARQKGKVGIVLNTYYYYPKNENDTDSPEVAFQFAFDRYAHPIFSKSGDYPPMIKARIAENSKFEKLPRSRLPTFSKKWIEYIKGTADYIGLNHYTSTLVEPLPKINSTLYPNDDGLDYTHHASWPATPSKWLKVVPQGFTDTLRKIKENYNNPPVYVTENGVADDGLIEDNLRIKYFYLYLQAMLTAIKDYGCNVKSYTIWSFLDNFEWDQGYQERFGIVYVNFTDPNRKRTLKKSAYWIANVIRTRKLPSE